MCSSIHAGDRAGAQDRQGVKCEILIEVWDPLRAASSENRYTRKTLPTNIGEEQEDRALGNKTKGLY